MTIVNLRLSGELEHFVERLIRAGYATSKAEVLRMGLIGLKEKQQFEDISDDPALEKYLKDVKAGKVRTKIVGKNADLKRLLSE